MIVRRLFPFAIVLLLLPLYVISLSMTATQKKMLPQDSETSYLLPSSLLKITALEFDGLAADFLFLKALSFYGGTLDRTERPRIKVQEWLWLYDVLNASADLDPYFFDPYYFANASFTWEAHMVKEVNVLLTKGKRYRDWDWLIPFYMGFNEFYFLQNNTLASEYLMEGSKRPDAPPLLATLAVRLAYKGNRTKIAIVFIQESLKKTKDKITRKELETRLETLSGIYVLEQAVEAYRGKYGSLPRDLKELMSQGLIAKIPVDPFGGEFYLNQDGSVKSTSDMYVVKK
jgi:hypothetical protein